MVAMLILYCASREYHFYRFKPEQLSLISVFAPAVHYERRVEKELAKRKAPTE
jgi:hypothetical protein